MALVLLNQLPTNVVRWTWFLGQHPRGSLYVRTGRIIRSTHVTFLTRDTLE